MLYIIKLFNTILKSYGIEKVTIDNSVDFVTLFSYLQTITNQEIILIFDEFDNIFNINKEDRDSFLSCLRSLKNNKNKHNIMVKINK